MTALAYADVERALLPFRTGRRIILGKIREALVQGELVSNPFLFLSRAFCRIKSADSICEKIRRKQLLISSTAEIPYEMPDILGFRFLCETPRELQAVDLYLSRSFEVVSRTDRTCNPDEFGKRGIEYALHHRVGEKSYPFEVQLRTFLHHYWAAASFHLFHKQPRAVAEEKRAALVHFSEVLQAADEAAQSVVAPPRNIDQKLETETVKAIENRTRVIAVGPGEHFLAQAIVQLTGNDVEDHARIVEHKLAAYDRWPGCALVECCCLNFLTFLLNEPHVYVTLDSVHGLSV